MALMEIFGIADQRSLMHMSRADLKYSRHIRESSFPLDDRTLYCAQKLRETMEKHRITASGTDVAENVTECELVCYFDPSSWATPGMDPLVKRIKDIVFGKSFTLQRVSFGPLKYVPRGTECPANTYVDPLIWVSYRTGMVARFGIDLEIWDGSGITHFIASGGEVAAGRHSMLPSEMFWTQPIAPPVLRHKPQFVPHTYIPGDPVVLPPSPPSLPISNVEVSDSTSYPPFVPFVGHVHTAPATNNATLHVSNVTGTGAPSSGFSTSHSTSSPVFVTSPSSTTTAPPPVFGTPIAKPAGTVTAPLPGHGTPVASPAGTVTAPLPGHGTPVASPAATGSVSQKSNRFSSWLPSFWSSASKGAPAASIASTGEIDDNTSNISSEPITLIAVGDGAEIPPEDNNTAVVDDFPQIPATPSAPSISTSSVTDTFEPDDDVSSISFGSSNEGPIFNISRPNPAVGSSGSTANAGWFSSVISSIRGYWSAETDVVEQNAPPPSEVSTPPVFITGPFRNWTTFDEIHDSSPNPSSQPMQDSVDSGSVFSTPESFDDAQALIPQNAFERDRLIAEKFDRDHREREATRARVAAEKSKEARRKAKDTEEFEALEHAFKEAERVEEIRIANEKAAAAAEAAQRLRVAEEAAARVASEEAAQKRREEAAVRAAAAEDERRRVAAQEAADRKAAKKVAARVAAKEAKATQRRIIEEANRTLLAAQESAVRIAAEEAERRRVADEENARRIRAAEERAEQESLELKKAAIIELNSIADEEFAAEQARIEAEANAQARREMAEAVITSIASDEPKRYSLLEQETEEQRLAASTANQLGVEPFLQDDNSGASSSASASFSGEGSQSSEISSEGSSQSAVSSKRSKHKPGTIRLETSDLADYWNTVSTRPARGSRTSSVVSNPASAVQRPVQPFVPKKSKRKEPEVVPIVQQDFEEESPSLQSESSVYETEIQPSPESVSDSEGSNSSDGEIRYPSDTSPKIVAASKKQVRRIRKQRVIDDAIRNAQVTPERRYKSSTYAHPGSTTSPTIAAYITHSGDALYAEAAQAQESTESTNF